MVVSVRANFADIYLRGMHDRSMRSGTKLAREIRLTDWSTAGNLSNRSAGVQIPRDICTRFGRYLYSANSNYFLLHRHLNTRWGWGVGGLLGLGRLPGVC